MTDNRKVSSTNLGLILLTFMVLVDGCWAADEFFSRTVVDSCSSDESVRRCLGSMFDKLTTLNEAIARSRERVSSNTKLLGFEEELIELHAELDQRAGVESIITHLLREDCDFEPESGWSETSCMEDLEHIPRFDRTMMEIYVAKMRQYLEDSSLILQPEDRLANVIHLQAKLNYELRAQVEFREQIKAGFWIDERYAKRRQAAIKMSQALLGNE